MLRIAGLSLLLLSLSGVLGCAAPKIEVDGIRVREPLWTEAEAQLRRRAAFDLECAPEGIALTLLHLADGQPVEVGAAGCGKRTVYSRASVGGYVSGTWLRQECSSPSPE